MWCRAGMSVARSRLLHDPTSSEADLRVLPKACLRGFSSTESTFLPRGQWRIDIKAHDVADLELDRFPGDLERFHLVRPEGRGGARMLRTVVASCRNSPASALRVQCRAFPDDPRAATVARSTGRSWLSCPSLIGFFPGRRAMARRRRPSTPSARKRSHQRHTVGFDMPVRRIVSIRPRPEPSASLMRAWRASEEASRDGPLPVRWRLRYPSESPVFTFVDFPPICLLSRFAGRSKRRRDVQYHGFQKK